jgi:hypothetical protein
MPCPRAGQRNHRTAGRHQLGQQDDGNTQPVGRLQRVQPQRAYRLPPAAKTARRARRCHPSWNEHRCKQQHYPAECHYPAQGGGSTTAVRPNLLAPAGAAGAYELRRRINTAWVAGTHYQFASLAIPHDANSTAAAVLAAIGAEDWPTLYSLAGTSLRNAMSAQQFAQQISDEFNGGQVSGARQTGPISYTTNSAGASYANVPATFTVAQAGQTQTVSATVVLIREGRSWRWFTTKSA